MQPASFVDTNIFIYSLSGIDKKKQKRCVRLLEKAVDGEILLWTTEWVIAELLWFFHKQKWDWNDIRRTIESVLTMKGITVRQKDWITHIFERCKKATDFVDIVNIDLLKEEGLNKGYSYDKDLDVFPGFSRLVP